MAEIVQGLFGVSPESLNAQREQALQAQALQYAQLDPNQQAQMGFYQAGSHLGTGVAGLMGAQDPEMKKAQLRQQLLSTADTGSVQGLQALARSLQQGNDAQGAMQAWQKAQELAKGQGALSAQTAETALKQAQTTEIPGQIELRRAQAAKASFDVLSEEQAQAATKAALLADEMPLTQVEAIMRNPKARTTYFNKVVDKTQITEADGRIYLVNTRTGDIIKDLGKAADRSTKVNLNVNQKGEESFVKELGVLDAKKVSGAQTVRDSSISTLNALNTLASLPSDQLISGQFASGRIGATNLLTTLGLASPEDAARLATSQQYQKVAGDVVLQTLGGKLGSGFSNADREFISSLIPQLETNPEARRKLITFMQGKNQSIIAEANSLEDFARENKGLKGYKPTIPLSVSPSRANPLASLSSAELDARIRAARANQ